MIFDIGKKIYFIVIVIVVSLSFIPFTSSTFYADEDELKETSKEGMVATAHPLASLAGYEMLKMGGNAVDAAVAAAFAIGVVEPDGSGIGGGGGMVIYLAKEKKSIYINYYQKASERINDINYDFIDDRKSAKAILVPGTVDGLVTALEKYGTLPLSKVLAPAIKYSEEGFAIDATLASILLDNTEDLLKYESTSSIFLNDGFPLMEGDLLVQSELANTLKLISQYGRDGFYSGQVAETIVKEVQAAGGMITLNDLKNYKCVISEPLVGSYRGCQILTADLPQSGASIIQALNMLENRNLFSMGHFSNSVETAHLLAETFRRVYADRTQYMGDPKFENSPIAGLISKEYARVRFNDIDMGYANPKEYKKTKEGNPYSFNHSIEQDKTYVTPTINDDSPIFSDDADDESYSKKGGWGDDVFDSWGKKKKKSNTKDSSTDTKKKEVNESELETEYDGHTTHLSVMDKDGNVVSLTQTLGTFFGSYLTTAGAIMNCSYSNFSQTLKINMVKQNKQPRSSIAPTLVLKDGNPVLVVGSPGATRIISTVVQLIVNVIDFNMNAVEANYAPRLFCQKNDDYLHLEKRFSTDVINGLEKKGHRLRIHSELSLFFGGASIVTFNPLTGEMMGSADPRRGGNAMGL